MSISQGSKLEWQDIENLYTNLNTALTKFNLSTINIPSNPGLATPENVSNLKDVVNANINANSYLKNQVNLNEITPPVKEEKITVQQMSDLSGTITSMNNACPYDGSTYYASFNNNYFGCNNTNRFFANFSNSYFSCDNSNRFFANFSNSYFSCNNSNRFFASFSFSFNSSSRFGCWDYDSSGYRRN